jgi:hypothetical protein
MTWQALSVWPHPKLLRAALEVLGDGRRLQVDGAGDGVIRAIARD